ncbi:hypothetical protein GCM10010207_43910 [Streptomyces atratus]|nr:hypothetical protein GCM10010207_43910 [Streptomyces atratus]
MSAWGWVLTHSSRGIQVVLAGSLGASVDSVVPLGFWFSTGGLLFLSGFALECKRKRIRPPKNRLNSSHEGVRPFS